MFGFILCLACFGGFLNTGTAVDTKSNFSVESNFKVSALEETSYGVTIVNETAVLVSAADEWKLCFSDKMISISDFDYYRIISENGEERYIIADTYAHLENQTSSAFATLRLYERSGSYFLNAQYADESDYTFYNISASISVSQYLSFKENAIDWTYGDDSLSIRLQESINTYDALQAEREKEKEKNGGLNVDGKGRLMNSSNTQNVGMQPLGFISRGTYDSYTDNDGIVKVYKDQYFDDAYNGSYFSDDSIVRIIPKELFFQTGTHFYIGKEYGFFLRVTNDYLTQNANCADVFVFDIDIIVHSLPNKPEGSVKVTPLFQFRYQALDRNKVDWVDMNPALDRVVFRHMDYDKAAYFLKDISFRHSLANVNALNRGDLYYDKNQDNGDFIIQTRYNYSAVGLNGKGGSVLGTILNFAAGYVPYVGEILSVYYFGVEFVNTARDNFFYAEQYVANNEANIHTRKTNAYDQISAYGDLIKTVNVYASAHSDNPALIGIGNYAQSIYVAARKSAAINKTEVINSIQATICQDNTSRWWLFGWHEKGGLDIMDTASSIYRATKTDRLSVAKGTNYALQIPSNGTYSCKFQSASGGNHTFNTVGNMDTVIDVYDGVTGNLIATDDDGGNGNNASVSVNLMAKSGERAALK